MSAPKSRWQRDAKRRYEAAGFRVDKLVDQATDDDLTQLRCPDCDGPTALGYDAALDCVLVIRTHRDTCPNRNGVTQ